MCQLPPDLLEFLRELELNNNKEWFEANKARYETSVKGPTEQLAGEVIERLREIYPGLNIAPKDALFRIYRDVRFGKDKTPYKTHVAMAVGPRALRDENAPSVYFRIGPREFEVGSGYHMLEPSQLKAIRAHLAANLAEFQARLDDPDFRSLFGTIKGEQSTSVSPDLKAAAGKQPLLFKKQFTYGATYEAEEALRSDLPEFLLVHFRAGQPMNNFLYAAFF